MVLAFSPPARNHNNIQSFCGYLLLERAVSIPENLLKQISECGDVEPIFNHNLNAPDNDSLRLQVKLPGEVQHFGRNVLTSWETGRVATDWVGLISLPGCREQAAHVDWVPSTLPKSQEQLRPLGVFVALQDNACVNVWPGSHNIWHHGTPNLKYRKETIRMNAGDVIVFDAGLVHGGCAYQEKNVRLHKYLDVPSVQRIPNQTWIVAEDATVAIRDWFEDLL